MAISKSAKRHNLTPSPHPIRNHAPYLNHETLTQDQQAGFLGVRQETVLNLGHPCPVGDLADHPLKSGAADYTSGGAAKRSLSESDRPGHGVYGSFTDPKTGFSTDHESLKNWAGFASANSQVGPNSLKRAQPPAGDRRSHRGGRRGS